MTQTNDPPTVLDIGLIPNSNEKADLDAPNTSGGKLVIGQAPNITITETTVVADAAERLALEVQEGDIAVQTNVSTTFIFTGGDNVANNWETLDFDAVGAIDGETISPANVNISGSINGADTSAGAAGEALTSDGSGSLTFAPVGGIEEVATFADLPAINPPQIAYTTSEDEYYHSNVTRDTFDITNEFFTASIPAEGTATGIAWNNDGTRFYQVAGANIFQSTVSIPFDVTTASLGPSISTQDNRTFGMTWNDDGSRLYEVGEDSGGDIYQSIVSSPFDITTATFDTSISSQDSQPFGITWNNDGSQLYTAALNSGKLNQYSVSTPFEISTASFNTSIPSQDGRPRSIVWNNDGTRLFTVGDNNGEIYQFTVSTAFDITTATFDTSVSSTDGRPTAIAWNNDGSRLYEGGDMDRKIFQSDTGPWVTF